MTTALTALLSPALPLAFGMPGPTEWMIIAGIGLLLFGKRLPEVGRALGQSIVEFKRGLKGVGDTIESESSKPAPLPPPAESPKQIAGSGDQSREA